MSIITRTLHRNVTPFLTGAAVAAATLSGGMATVVLATAAGLFGFVSHRAGARLLGRVVKD